MPVDDLVDRAQLLETAFDIGVDAGDQLELRLAEVGGDMRMRQRRAERRRMRGAGQHAVRPDAQAFFFNAAPKAPAHFGCEHIESFYQRQTGSPRLWLRQGTARLKVKGKSKHE
jgi:hypothetical protein